jgi:hypothetical protein
MPSVYAALEDALLVATQADSEWETTERLTDHRPQCVTVHPDAPERLFVGTFDDGLHRSIDGGDTFERVGRTGIAEDAYRASTGDSIPSVMSVCVAPQDPDTVWVGTEPSRVYHSVDGGESWESHPGLTDLPSASECSFPPRPDTHHVRWIEVDPGDPDRLYVGIEQGALVRTVDGGETWLDHPGGASNARRDNHTLAIHPDVPGRIYAAAGDGYAESEDGGDTWITPQEGLAHTYCWSVAVDPATPNTVLLSAASGPRSAHNPAIAESYVYRHRAGERWTRCDADLPAGEGLLRPVLAPGNAPGEFYALTNHGLYRSADAGETFDLLDIPWPERFDSQTPQGLVVVE